MQSKFCLFPWSTLFYLCIYLLCFILFFFFLGGGGGGSNLYCVCSVHTSKTLNSQKQPPPPPQKKTKQNKTKQKTCVNFLLSCSFFFLFSYTIRKQVFCQDNSKLYMRHKQNLYYRCRFIWQTENSLLSDLEALYSFPAKV